jgi:hypothetical protein
MNPPTLRPFPAGEPFERLAKALLALLESARPADQQGDRLAGWKPARGECHDNVDRWVALYPEARAVRGWRHEPFEGLGHRFVAHSVVRSSDGELVDVTLSASQGPRRFIEHPGSERDFFAFLRCPRPFHELVETIPGIDEIPFNTAAELSVADADETDLGDSFL